MGPFCLADFTQRWLQRQTLAARCVGSLNRGQHTKFFEALDIIRVNDLDVFDAMSTIALAVMFTRSRITIQHHAHGAITNGMHGNLQTQGIGSYGDSIEFGLRE